MKNTRIPSFLTIIALLALIVIRLIVNDASEWVSYINYVGLIISVFGFFSEFSSRYKKNTVANFIKGISLIIIALMIVVGCVIVTGVVKLDNRANDEILLFTLLVSLPMNYYCELLGKIVRKQSNMEDTHGAD